MDRLMNNDEITVAINLNEDVKVKSSKMYNKQGQVDYYLLSIDDGKILIRIRERAMVNKLISNLEDMAKIKLKQG